MNKGIKNLIGNLEMLDEKIPEIAENDEKFANKFFPHTIQETIEILKEYKNMKIKEVINQAIKGGWNHPQETEYDKAVDYHYKGFKSYNGFWLVINFDKTTVTEDENTGKKETVHITTHMKLEDVLLDCSFWQSLGKALGWELCNPSGNHYSIGYHHTRGVPLDTFDVDAVNSYWNSVPEYIYRWHQFIDHLIEGKSAEDFFEKL